MELNASLTGSSYSIATVRGPFNAIGLSSPNGVAVDPASNIWFASGGSGPTPTHSYFSAGPYTVTLTVTNAYGLASAASTTMATIAALPALTPVANAGGPYSGTAYTALNFNGTGRPTRTTPPVERSR